MDKDGGAAVDDTVEDVIFAMLSVAWKSSLVFTSSDDGTTLGLMIAGRGLPKAGFEDDDLKIGTIGAFLSSSGICVAGCIPQLVMSFKPGGRS